MAGWDTQNASAFYQWSRGHAPPSYALPSHASPSQAPITVTSSHTGKTHDDFVSKYLRNHTMTSSTSGPDAIFHPTMHHSVRSGLLFTSPQSERRISQTFGPSFCNKDNLEHCVSYLDQEMTVVGFPSLYTSDRGTSGAFDIVQLVNCCYELIQRHQQHVRKQEELEAKQMRSDSDLEHLQGTHGRLKERIEQLERDNVALAEKERQQQNQNKTLAVKLKNVREELKKLESIVKHRDTQFKHDLKKKEREANKMKERIHQLLTDKNQERRIGMDILNSLQRADGKRATWKTGKTGSKHEEEMYRLIITNYEERQKEMMLENQVLRESLSNMQKELVDLLNRRGDTGLLSSLNTNSDNDDDATSADDLSIEELSHGHFQMPYEMVREGIETSLKQKWQKLRERIQRMEKEQQQQQQQLVVSSSENKENSGGSSGGSIPNNSPSNSKTQILEGEVTRLKDQVKMYHDIIEQQEQVLQVGVLQSVPDTNMNDSLLGLLKDSPFLEEKEILAEEKRMFYQQKAAFEKERRSFTDAAIRLGHERKKFEEERGNFLQQQLMLSPGNQSLSPPLRPPKSINTSSSPSGFPSEHNTPLTPPNDRTPIGQRTVISTPTTVELYRALKLIPDQGECINSSRESLHAPSYYSDTDRSGASTPRSGAATPRSVCSQSSNTGTRRTNQTSSCSATPGNSSRSEERKHGQRNTPHHGHRAKKGDFGKR